MRRGQETPWGRCTKVGDQLKDFPGEVGTPHHGVTAPKLVTSPYHTPTASHHEVGNTCVTPVVSHPKLGTPLWGPTDQTVAMGGVGEDVTVSSQQRACQTL